MTTRRRVAHRVIGRAFMELEGPGEVVERVVEMAQPWLQPAADTDTDADTDHDGFDRRAATIYLGRASAPAHDWRVLADQPLEFEPPRRLLVDDDGRRVVVDEPDPEWLAITTLRILRNGLKYGVSDGRMIFLHGGGVDIGGTTFLMCGRSRSGKTSTMLMSLTAERSAYLSNDDVTLVEQGEGFVATGWPRSIVLRRDSIEGLRTSGLPVPTRLQLEHLRHPSNRWGTNWDHLVDGLPENVWVLPAELTGMFSADVSVEARPAALVFPVFDDDCVERSVLVELDADAALASVRANCEPVASSFDGFMAEWFPPYRPPDDLVARAAQLPCYQLRQTLGALGSSRSLLVGLSRDLTERTPASD